MRNARRPRLSAADEIIASLRADIANGRFPAGARLPPERELAVRFGVSQPTVREALRALDAVGLIEVHHGRGAFATGDTRRYVWESLDMLVALEDVTILDVLTVRAAIGPYTARRAARRATDADVVSVATLAAVLEAPGEPWDAKRHADAVVAFQAAISAAAHEPLAFTLDLYLIRLLLDFQRTAWMDRDPDFWRDWAGRFVGRRRLLVELLRVRDEEGLVAALNDYLADQRARFTEDPDLTRLRLSGPLYVTASPSE